MKKYIIKMKDGSEQHVMPAVHNTRKEALLTILQYAAKVVEDDKDDSRVEISVDYMVKEVEDTAVNELIPDFESAKKVIGSIRFIPAKESLSFLTTKINIRHARALAALNQLFTIAEAWNKEDGFIPDFSDEKQDKWFPWFRYDPDSERFVCMDTHYAPTRTHAGIGSRLCFKTSERAKQFGAQFIELFNKAFL